MADLNPNLALLLRDLFALPDHERALVYQKLTEDLEQASAPSPITRANEARINAVEVFDKVAEHLGLDNDFAKLALRMREFDAVPSRVREGYKARQLAAVYLGSWPLLKQAAIRAPLQTSPTQAKHRKRFLARRSYYARQQTGLHEWLENEPVVTTRAAYNAWRDERNRNLKEGERPFVSADTITRNWGQSWTEIVTAAQQGQLRPPAEPVSAGGGAAEGVAVAGGAAEGAAGGGAEGAAGDPSVASPKDLIFETDLIARRLADELRGRKLTYKALAKLTGLDPSTFSRILGDNRGERIEFSTVIKLAAGLNLPTDWFATADGKTGLPVLPKQPRGRRRNRRRKTRPAHTWDKKKKRG